MGLLLYVLSRRDFPLDSISPILQFIVESIPGLLYRAFVDYECWVYFPSAQRKIERVDRKLKIKDLTPEAL
jgi:hypothetical protein